MANGLRRRRAKISDTTFTNGVTLTDADWFNDLNRLNYTIFGDPANAAAVRTALGLTLAQGNYLSGVGMANNAGDATNDIDIASGQCTDSTNAVNITCAAMTKRLDANWAAGTNQGFRNSGAAITNTTYHIYAVATAAGVQDYYAHTSTTVATVITALQAETGGASYLYARRIGSIIRSAGAILAFIQDGDYFRLSSVVLDVDVTNPGTAAVTRTLTVPLGINVQAMVNVYAFDTTPTAFNGLLSDLAATDQAPSATAAPLGNFRANSAGDGLSMQLVVRTNTSSQIRSRISNSTGNTVLRIATAGWSDSRGK